MPVTNPSESPANKDASGGYVGKTLETFNIYNTARTFLNVISAGATTAIRTWTHPDDSGTYLLDSTLAGVINAATVKTTPVAEDKIGIYDSVSGLLQSINFTAIKTFFGIGVDESSTLFLNRQGNWATTPAAGVLNDYLEQAFTAQTSVKVLHNFGAKPVPLVIVGVAKAEPLNILYTEDDETTLSDSQFIVKFANPTTGLIIASVGAPPLLTTIAVSDNYTMLAADSYIEVSVPEKTITLLTAVGIDGKQLTIDNNSNGVIYVDAAGSETIQGELIQIIPAQSSITIRSNGANWRII